MDTPPGNQGSKSHYDILEVSPRASAEVIRGAYRSLAQRWHPDRNPGNEAECTARLKAINAAFACLSDPEMRAAYDRERAAQDRTHARRDAAGQSGDEVTRGPNPQASRPQTRAASTPASNDAAPEREAPPTGEAIGTSWLWRSGTWLLAAAALSIWALLRDVHAATLNVLPALALLLSAMAFLRRYRLRRGPIGTALALLLVIPFLTAFVDGVAVGLAATGGAAGTPSWWSLALTWFALWMSGAWYAKRGGSEPSVREGAVAGLVYVAVALIWNGIESPFKGAMARAEWLLLMSGVLSHVGLFVAGILTARRLSVRSTDRAQYLALGLLVIGPLVGVFATLGILASVLLVFGPSTAAVIPPNAIAPGAAQQAIAGMFAATSALAAARLEPRR